MNGFNFYLTEPTKPDFQKTHTISLDISNEEMKAGHKDDPDSPGMILLFAAQDKQRGGPRLGSQPHFHTGRFQLISHFPSICIIIKHRKVARLLSLSSNNIINDNSITPKFKQLVEKDL